MPTMLNYASISSKERERNEEGVIGMCPMLFSIGGLSIGQLHHVQGCLLPLSLPG